jgi:hypothetical protein
MIIPNHFTCVCSVLFPRVPVMSSSQQSSGHTWTEGDFEHPNEKIRHSLIVALVFAFTLPTVAVGLRLLARRMTGNRLFLDDYLILVALVWLPLLHHCREWSLTLIYDSCLNMDALLALSFVSQAVPAYWSELHTN